MTKLGDRTRQLCQAAGSAIAVLDEHLRSLEPLERIEADQIAVVVDRLNVARQGLRSLWRMIPQTAAVANGRKKK